ncbi:hypothetical protein GOODEAATRI_003489 [Goodea atripinnis]|uniref:Uncharacterized protein n=1 Tax=Goodea atripinnis TaxID=208336 RepID=A0ABV0MF23_9TELE
MMRVLQVLVSVLTKSLCKMCPLCSAGAQSGRPESHAADRGREPGRGRWSGPLRPPTGGQPAGESEKPAGSIEGDEAVEMVKFNFNVESLELVLYHNDPKQNLRLGELALRLMKASGKILNNGSMEVNTILTSCTLDDVRSGVDRVTSRMVGLKEENGHQAMIDVTFRQDPAERELVAVLQKLYLCVSVEFLMAVADFFLQALPQNPAAATLAAPSDKLPLRRNQKICPVSAASAVKTLLRVVIVDPEVVFVANLMNADAPALMASFQGDFNLLVEEDSTQKMRANLRDLKVLACPFIQSKEKKAVTTAEQSQESKADVSNLWSTMNVYNCNFWFLGVDQATEITESYKESDGSNEGETFTAQVKVVQVTLESGLGHRTVPLLLAESSFSGKAKNWSSLLQLKADMTLEVNYFNEVHAVWEPLIERVDSGRRRWNLELEVMLNTVFYPRIKKNPVMDKSPVHGDDFLFLPEPQSAISISSKDTLNITVSKCSLNVFQKLAECHLDTVRSPTSLWINPVDVSATSEVRCYRRRCQNLQSIGTAEPEKEFHVDLDAYRCQLFVRPAGALDGLYGSSSSCVAWKEQVHCSSEVQSVLQCPASDSNLLPLMVSTLAVPDDLQYITSHGEEDWDPAYVIHLHPVAALSNLLPYTVSYIMEVLQNAKYYVYTTIKALVLSCIHHPSTR